MADLQTEVGYSNWSRKPFGLLDI